jgi:hypothetical protein
VEEPPVSGPRHNGVGGALRSALKANFAAAREVAARAAALVVVLITTGE